jgi:hypothetical protein
MADVFISYAREDREVAQRLAAALTARGWSVYWDRQIRSGQRFAEVIEAELSAARCVVVLWSEHSVRSDWVIDEAEAGRDRGVLAPARITDVPLPMGFRQIHTTDLIGWHGEAHHEGIEALLDGVEARVGAAPDPYRPHAPKGSAGLGPLLLAFSKRLPVRLLVAGSLAACLLTGAWLFYGHREQRDQAMELASRFTSSEILEARSRIDEAELACEDALNGVLQRTARLRDSGADSSRSADLAREQGRYRQVVDQLVRRAGVSNVTRILDYFDESARCAAQGICDPDTVDAMLGDHARKALATYLPFICDRRRNSDPDFGSLGAAFYLRSSTSGPSEGPRERAATLSRALGEAPRRASLYDEIDDLCEPYVGSVSADENACDSTLAGG